MRPPDIKVFFEKIKKNNIDIIHEIIVQPWQQRVFRINDPDGFIIEIAESMNDVIKRLFSERSQSDEIITKTSMSKEIADIVLKSIVK